MDFWAKQSMRTSLLQISKRCEEGIESGQSGLEQIIYKNYVIWTNSIAMAIGRMSQQCSLKKANMA